MLDGQGKEKSTRTQSPRKRKQHIQPRRKLATLQARQRESLAALPDEFQFPKLTLAELIRMWYCGDRNRSIPPYRLLRAKHIRMLKSGRQTLSMMKKLVAQVERATTIVGRPELLVEQWTEGRALDLYNGIKHLFRFPGAYRRRHEEISWKTCYNVLAKRKQKLLGEEQEEIMPTPSPPAAPRIAATPRVDEAGAHEAENQTQLPSTKKTTNKRQRRTLAEGTTSRKRARVVEDPIPKIRAGNDDSSTTFPRVPGITRAELARTRENIVLLPDDFQFPKMTLAQLITMWYCGDTNQDIPPYRFLHAWDVKMVNYGKHKLSMMRSFVGHVERATNIVDRPELLVEKWTERRALDLYNGVKRLFHFPSLQQSNYATLSWKTYHNALLKRKERLVGEEEGEVFPSASAIDYARKPPRISEYHLARERENLVALPDEFQFPTLTLAQLLRMWYCGDTNREIPPYRLLRAGDVKMLKHGKQILSMMKNLISQVERAAFVVDRSELLVEKWAERHTLDLYNGVKHLFQFPCIYRRRHEEISWKTYYNVLGKRKQKLFGEMHGEIVSMTPSPAAPGIDETNTDGADEADEETQPHSKKRTKAQWARVRENLALLPDQFKFPKLTLAKLIRMWYCGDSNQDIPPYIFLRAGDIKMVKNGRQTLCMMKNLVGHVERAAIIANRPELLVDKWTQGHALDLYNGVKHFFWFPSMQKRRCEEISWKTYYNVLVKRKQRLFGEKEVKTASAAPTPVIPRIGEADARDAEGQAQRPPSKKKTTKRQRRANIGGVLNRKRTRTVEDPNSRDSGTGDDVSPNTLSHGAEPTRVAVAQERQVGSPTENECSLGGRCRHPEVKQFRSCYRIGCRSKVHHLCAIDYGYLDQENELNVYCSVACSST